MTKIRLDQNKILTIFHCSLAFWMSDDSFVQQSLLYFFHTIINKEDEKEHRKKGKRTQRDREKKEKLKIKIRKENLYLAARNKQE